MFYVHPGVLIDPFVMAPTIFIETKGLVVDNHRCFLKATEHTDRWEVDGTNIPSSPEDPGTPDIYVIPQYTQQGGNILRIFVDLFNVTPANQEYTLRVEIHQDDYEPDVLFDESGELGTQRGEKTESYGVFVPLSLMT